MQITEMKLTRLMRSTAIIPPCMAMALLLSGCAPPPGRVVYEEPPPPAPVYVEPGYRPPPVYVEPGPGPGPVYGRPVYEEPGGVNVGVYGVDREKPDYRRRPIYPGQPGYNGPRPGVPQGGQPRVGEQGQPRPGQGGQQRPRGLQCGGPGQISCPH
ncbi:hypothetical protein [Methylovirgula sp. 4M-Z18]|uniref:hypothetical protein n=1 Tax=Methylovirgula sp. 4M-Z18 TaxID=2293567 RepID=UPI000E398286|nr:hypothetical protein [Methylovirgula sp. 4M-Z18]RFB80893.1 hypothetical protein DYH55_05305 [Methylovirgula sp. 4M-Z18]